MYVNNCNYDYQYVLNEHYLTLYFASGSIDIRSFTVLLTLHISTMHRQRNHIWFSACAVFRRSNYRDAWHGSLAVYKRGYCIDGAVNGECTGGEIA